MKTSSSTKLGIALISITGFAAFSWPLFFSQNVLGLTIPTTYYWIFLAVLPISFLLLALEINRGELELSAIALLGVLSALIAALRQIGAGAVGIEPMWFLIILGARAFGATFGFALGSISMALSALLTGGIGPWLPFQILAASWVGLLAGCLPKNLRGRGEIIALSIYGALASLSYGALMDLQLWPWLIGGETQLSFRPENSLQENLSRFITFHFLTAMAWDIPRAILTATLIAVTGGAILRSLRRTLRKVQFI